MDEQALIEQAQRGELEAFNELVLHYQGLAYNVALRIMRDPPSAADATQEAFLSAFGAIRRYRGGSFRAWLMRIVTNACYDELRRRKRRPASSLEEMQDHGATEKLHDPAESPEQAAQRAELARAIETCLEQLIPEFRTVAILVDLQGFDYQEVSQTIDRPLGTVKSRLARARAQLRECLSAYGELLPGSLRLSSGTIG